MPNVKEIGIRDLSLKATFIHPKVSFKYFKPVLLK